MTRGRRLILLAFATGALAGSQVETAAACTCAEPNVRAQYREADAAFVGVLENVRTIGTGRAVYRYAVRRGYKRRLGRTVWVRSSRHSASCGLPDEIGETYAMFLQRTGKRWSSGVCWLTRPGALRRAARAERAGLPSARSPRARAPEGCGSPASGPRRNVRQGTAPTPGPPGKDAGSARTGGYGRD